MMNYIYTIILFVVLGFFGYGYKLYKDNETLRTNQSVLEKSIDEQYQVILKNKKDYEDITQINENLRKLNETQELRITNLSEIFQKEKNRSVIIDNKEYKIKVTRDIGKLATSKPKMVQNAINKGVLESFICFESITHKDYKGDLNVCK